MDFNDTPEEAAFRAEARKWLEANATRKSDDKQAYRARVDDPGLLKRAKEWQAKKAAAGYARITWPKEYGGQGGTPIQQVIYQQEEANFLVPLGFFDIGLGMCIPTMMAYATPEQLKRHVKPALYGEEVWCQLFSEPAAGSDVAGIRTKAERDGDDWIINGQKVWTSGAHYSDWGIIITRTDPNVPKHQGLTMFFLNMKSPGVEARPIKQISGAANFNEVFFTNVRVPDAQRLGKVGDGWKAALTTLMNERLAVGMPSGGLDVDELLELARNTELEDGAAIRNGHVRSKIADWYVQAQGLKMQDLGAMAMELMGPAGIMTSDVPGAGGFQAQWIGGAGFRIAGGTDEILRNIVAERVLGLPQDVRVDKDVAFNQLGKTK
jgi:acyl-CoA dehydrogenase